MICVYPRFANYLNTIWHKFNNSKSSLSKIKLTDSPSKGWSQPYLGNSPYNFALPAYIEEDAILFVGMNPSYIPSNKNNKYLNYWERPTYNADANSGWQFEEFYNPQSVFYNHNYFKDLRKLLCDIMFYGKMYPYGDNKNNQISTEIKEDSVTYRHNTDEVSKHLKYAHLDLLSIRHTKQDEVKKIIVNKYKKGDQALDLFIESQLSLFRILVIMSNPKVIVVNDGLVSKILRNEKFFRQPDTLDKTVNIDTYSQLRSTINMKLKWANDLDTYAWVNPYTNKIVPVFLSGMTSGQGMIDLGSRERLIAQVAKSI